MPELYIQERELNFPFFLTLRSPDRVASKANGCIITFFMAFQAFLISGLCLAGASRRLYAVLQVGTAQIKRNYKFRYWKSSELCIPNILRLTKFDICICF